MSAWLYFLFATLPARASLRKIIYARVLGKWQAEAQEEKFRKFCVVTSMRADTLTRPFVLLVAVLSFCASRAGGQTLRTPTLNIDLRDENNNRVTLPGNVHPFARPEFDQGSVTDAQPLRRTLVLLQRSPDCQQSCKTDPLAIMKI